VREAQLRPAFYAARAGALGDWWTLLHAPYTAWHLSYVVIGASLAPVLHVDRMLATLGAFFLAVGVAAHALDELNGRPVGTAIPGGALVVAVALSLLGAVGIGAAGVVTVGVGLIPFIVVGVVLVLAYDLELFGGRLHTDVGFAAAWGAFPVLTAYYAQAERLDLAAALAALGAFALSYAQRALSTPARLLRRRTRRAECELVLRDGETRVLGTKELLQPLERALMALCWSTVALAAAMAVARLV
jgi:hypothetical protein